MQLLYSHKALDFGKKKSIRVLFDPDVFGLKTQAYKAHQGGKWKLKYTTC